MGKVMIVKGLESWATVEPKIEVPAELEGLSADSMAKVIWASLIESADAGELDANPIEVALKAAFDAVKHPEDWRRPAVIISESPDIRNFAGYVFCHYHGGSPMSRGWTVASKGYQAY